MRVREYQEGDLEAVAHAFTSAVHELTSDHYDRRQRDAWAPRPPSLVYWRERVAGVQILIAEAPEETVAGFLGYHETGHIDLLFTHPRFSRQGVASRLHERAEHELRSIGVHDLFTEASELSRPFFERCGYAIVRRELAPVRGVDMHHYVMRRHAEPTQ